MPRFYLYEEYGARYESILHLVASTSKAIPSWGAFERGIEALMNSLLPKKQTEEGKKKGLTLEDLLIKVRCMQIYSMHGLISIILASAARL